MTADRVKLFLRCFYEHYIIKCYEGFELETEENATIPDTINNYDVVSYFIKYLDIYVENSAFMKEYEIIYKPALFTAMREKQPEDFNELEIFLIENIQLFMHTILEAALKKALPDPTMLIGVVIHIKNIDNKEVKLVDLVDEAEESMRKLKIMPPAMG